MSSIQNYKRYDLRFLKRENLTNTIEVYQNMMSDYIKANGVDVIYFRRYWTFDEKDEAKQTADPIYGADPTAKYTISAKMVVFMEVLADAYLLTRFGIQNESEVQIFIAIRDFVETFKPLIGAIVEKTYNAQMSAQIGDSEIVGKINTPEIYGEVYGNLPANYNGLNTLNMTDLRFRALPRPKNDLIRKSFKYDVVESVSSLFSANLNINYTTGLISGNASGSISHRTNASVNQISDYTVRPQVGDFFRLDNTVLPDEYEITRVIDRQYTGTAYNPFFDKYAYICSCIRRTPSHEKVAITQTAPSYDPPSDLINSITHEPLTAHKTETNEKIDKFAQDTFSYGESNVGSDDAYGGYGN